MPGRSGTIDSIKVGLGIDMSQLEKDIGVMTKSLQRDVIVTPKINAPSDTAVKTWLRDLNTAVERSNQKGVRVPLEFNTDDAVRKFKAVIHQVQGAVEPIVVPVHFQRGDMPGGPAGGPSSTQPPTGGGSRREPTQGAPARGGVTTTTGAVLAAEVSGRAEQPPAVSARPAAHPPATTPVAAVAPRPAPRHQRVAPESRPLGPSQPIQPLTWDERMGSMIGGRQEQDVTGRTIRTRRPAATVRAEQQQAALFFNAWEGGDLSAIEAMFPGMEAAVTAKSPSQMKTAYARAIGGKRPQNIIRRLGKFGEGSRRDVYEQSEQYPMDFAMAEAMGALNFFGKPWLKKVGGIAAIQGGTTPSTQGRISQTGARPKTTPPPAASVKAAISEAARLQAGYTALEKRIADMPIDIGESAWAGPTSFGPLARPWDIATKRPITGSIVDRLKGVAGGGGLRASLSKSDWAKPSSLNDLPGIAANALNLTKVGEHGPEGIVDLPGGSQFVVPAHQMSPFMKLLQEGRLPAKDLTGRAMGGVGPAGLQILGGGAGTYATRRFRAGEIAYQEGRAANIGTMSNNIQRVHVVNMPGTGFGGDTKKEFKEALEEKGRVARSMPAGRMAAETQAGELGTEVSPFGGGLPRQGYGVPSGRQTTTGSRAKFAAEDAVSELQLTLDQVGVNISEAFQKSPVRALSVAMGQISQIMIGGRQGILERASQARALERRAQGALGEVRGATEIADRAQFDLETMAGTTDRGKWAEARDRMSAVQGKAFDKLFGVWEEQTQRIADIRPVVEEKVAAAKTASETILSPGQQVRSQAAGLVGIVGGTMLFTAAMNLSQVAIENLGKIATDAGDRLSGFAFTARRVTSEMAPEVIQRSGDINAVIAERMAALGVSGVETGGLARMTAITAGAQQFQQQQAFLRATQVFEGQRGNQIPGLGVGVGNGLFGTWIGQTPGIAESLGGTFGNPVSAVAATTIAPAVKDPLTQWLETVQNAEDIAFGRAPRNEQLLGLTDMIERQQRAAASANALTGKAVASFNEGVDRWVKFNGELSPGRLITTTDASLIERSTKALSDIGASREVREAWAGAGVAALGPGDRQLTGMELNRLLELGGRGATTPDVNQLLTVSRRQMEASFRAQARQFELQRELIPAAAAEQLIARPFPTNAMTGITATSGVDPIAAAAAGKYEGAITRSRDALADIRDEGLTELRNLGVPDVAIQSVAKLGASITALRTDAEDLQLGLEQAQYNEQIRISVRSIGDLVALNQRQAVSIGDQVVGATQLGELQRAQINDGRELTRIQLARSQRELNLQLSLSRLRSPGETPEERAVRRREAELLVREQQRELDIGKRTAQRGFRIEDIGFGRQLTDAVKQLGLLQRARAVTIEVRGIQKVIEAKEQLLQVKQAALDLARDMGVAARQGSIRIAETLEQRLGRVTEISLKALDTYVTGWLHGLEPVLPIVGLAEKQGTAQPRTGSNVGRGTLDEDLPLFVERGKRRASGGIDLVSRPTSFLAGEIGNEAVVVMRNPRMNGAPGGLGRGGGSPININVNVKADVRGEADEDRMVRKVVRALHDEVAMLVG